MKGEIPVLASPDMLQEPAEPVDGFLASDDDIRMDTPLTEGPHDLGQGDLIDGLPTNFLRVRFQVRSMIEPIGAGDLSIPVTLHITE